MSPTQPAPLIVVAEDDKVLRDTLTDILTLEGLEVRSATNGKEGLELCRQFRPAAILADAAMPMMDGFAMLAALKADPETRGIPVIMLSARAERDQIAHGLKLGAATYLTKPFRTSELMAAIRASL